jgi:hypothetical protein
MRGGDAPLFRTVATTGPLEDGHQPSIGPWLGAVRPTVTVLLPIGHDDTEFDRVLLDRVLPTVHRAAVENRHSRSSFGMQGHAERISDLIAGSNRLVRAGAATRAPWGRHEARWISLGHATNLVRDGVPPNPEP